MIYHMIGHVTERGLVSALCYSAPRAIQRGQSWTIRREAVTCAKCTARLAERDAQTVEVPNA